MPYTIYHIKRYRQKDSKENLRNSTKKIESFNMVAKYLSFITLILLFRAIVSTPIVNLQSMTKNLSKAILETIIYVNKTTANGWDHREKDCQLQKKLRQRLSKISEQEDRKFNESKSHSLENWRNGWEKAQDEKNEIYLTFKC